MAKARLTPEILELFLIGKTGHGKSATGNTILGREQFDDSDSGESATLKTAVGWAIYEGNIVKVVDGPGLIDTREDEKGQRIQAEDELSSGFVHCPKGFHALLLVLRYGVRYTEEEVKTVDILRSMFGHDFIRKHCILVFTHGENFTLATKKKTDKTFKGWLEEQVDDLGNLIAECENRAVLFHNMIDDKRDESVKTLFSFVNKIETRYTCKMFDDLKAERDSFILCTGAIALKEHIQCDISLLNAMLDPDAGEPDLNVLGPLLERLENALNQEDGRSEVVQSLMTGIEAAKNGKYAEAREIFMTIFYQGAVTIVSLWKISRMMFAKLLSEFWRKSSA